MGNIVPIMLQPSERVLFIENVQPRFYKSVLELRYYKTVRSYF